MFVGPSGAGLSRLRGLPRHRRTGAGTREAVAALPSARGVLRRPGDPRLAGNEPVRRHHRGTAAILGLEPSDVSSRPPRSGGALLGLGRPPTLRSRAVGQVRRGRGLRPEPPPRFRQPQSGRPQEVRPGHPDTELDPAFGRHRARWTHKGRPAVRWEERSHLAELPRRWGTDLAKPYLPTGLTPRRRFLVTGPAGTLFCSRTRRTASWVAYDRRALSPPMHSAPTGAS